MLKTVQTFGALLNSLILTAYGSQSAFARKVGNPVPFINQIIHGVRTPPLERVAAWADALTLEGQARQEFLELAHLAHAPEMVQNIVRDLRRKVEQAQQNQRLILQELSRRGIHVEGLRDDV